MLSLESPRWHELEANGDPLEIPPLLDSLRYTTSPEVYSQSLDDLWELVFHQYDVYTASYAVVPHLIDLMALKLPSERLALIVKIGMIVALAHRPDVAPVPDDLRADYTEALDRAAPLILECFSRGWSDEEYSCLCAALAAVQGHPVMAIDLLETFRAPSALYCDHCEEFFRSFGYALIKGSDEG